MALAAAPGGENPSPAFLAGQQHGAQLAVQHHAAAPKPPRPGGGGGGGGQTLNDLLAQAQQIAQGQTNQQVAAIRAQQQLYNNQAQSRATQMLNASTAAAQLLASLGLGDKTAASYNTAAQDLAGLAQGFSGQTQTDATNAANTVAAQAAQLGAPSGSVQTSTGQTSNPGAVGNVLYGLGGFIPGNLLLIEGQTQAAEQRGLPANFLAYGNQMANGELAAGHANADTLTQNILNARAQEPSLYQSILSSLNSTLTNQALAQSLIGSRNAATDATQGVAPNGQTLPGYQRTPNGVVKVPPGYTVNGSGNVVKIPGPAKPLSPTASKNLNTLADQLYGGVAPKKTYGVTGYDPNGKPIHGWVNEPGTGAPAVHYTSAYQRLIAAGASPAQARQMVNSRWAPGEGGRPLTPAQRQANQQAKKQGKKAVGKIAPQFRIP